MELYNSADVSTIREMLRMERRREEPDFKFTDPFDQCCEDPQKYFEDGCLVCLNCGATGSQPLVGHAPRVFSYEDSKKKITNESLSSNVFSSRTIIIPLPDGNMIDGRGHLISSKMRTTINRLSKINRSVIGSVDRAMWQMTPMLTRLKPLLSLSDVIMEDARKLYHECSKLKLSKVRGIESVLAVCIFIAMRVHKRPFGIQDILLQFPSLTEKKFKNAKKVILTEVVSKLGLKVTHLTPEHYIDRIHSGFDLSMKSRKYAFQVLEEVRKQNLDISGRDPKGIAAAVYYLGSKFAGEKVAQRKIAILLHITHMTMSKRLNEIKEKISEDELRILLQAKV